jgi:hypothetical protein
MLMNSRDVAPIKNNIVINVPNSSGKGTPLLRVYARKYTKPNVAPAIDTALLKSINL